MNYEECRDGHGRPGVFRRWFHHGCASHESLNGLVEGGRIETEFVEVFGLVRHGPSALVHLGLEDHLPDGQTVAHEPHGSVANTETDTKNRPNFSIMEGQSERRDERLVKADPSTVGRRGRAKRLPPLCRHFQSFRPSITLVFLHDQAGDTVFVLTIDQAGLEDHHGIVRRRRRGNGDRNGRFRRTGSCQLRLVVVKVVVVVTCHDADTIRAM